MIFEKLMMSHEGFVAEHLVLRGQGGIQQELE
jgi:hypothetical protein